MKRHSAEIADWALHIVHLHIVQVNRARTQR